MRGRVALWGPVLVYLAAIFYESSQPALPRLLGLVSDKLLHAAAYAVLSVLFVRALTGGFRRQTTVALGAAAVALTVLYGASDEFHQSFVPSRQMDVMDLVADGVGAIAAAGALYIWSRTALAKVR